MKKSMILIFIVILVANLNSQDRNPSPLTFSYKVNDTVRNNEPLKREYFKQNSFFLSTQWYGHPKMLQALKMQGNHGVQPAGTGLPIIQNPDTNEKMYHIWDFGTYDNAPVLNTSQLFIYHQTTEES